MKIIQIFYGLKCLELQPNIILLWRMNSFSIKWLESCIGGFFFFNVRMRDVCASIGVIFICEDFKWEKYKTIVLT